MNYDWMDEALCAQTDPELFFPEGQGGTRPIAKKICVSCPVQASCLAHAEALEGDLAHRYRHGTWGGAVPRTRANHATANRRATNDAARRERIIRLHGLDNTPSEIAAVTGCHERTVYRILADHRDGQIGDAA